MSNDEVTRLRTRKACEVPPAFVLLKEREEGESEREREREGKLSILVSIEIVISPVNTVNLKIHF